MHERMFYVKRFFALFTLCFIGLYGCQNDGQNNNNQGNNVVEMKQTNEMSSDDIAKHLVDLATSIPDVEDATAIVAGDYAVVGIDVNKNIDRSRVGTIKYTVGEALKDDPYGANALITADTDITERLRKMRESMDEGRPVAGIMEELAEIVNRIMPETPGVLFENDNENAPTRNNDQQLNPKEEQKLKKEQEKQDHER